MIRFIKKIFVLIVFIGIPVYMLYFFLRPSATLLSPIPQKDIFTFTFPNFSKKKNPDDLKKIILDTIGNTIPQYSVVVKDLQSNFSVNINENIIFTGASVNKLPILGALYFLAQKGDIDMDKQITIQPDDIQDYGTGSIRYDPPGTLYSIKTLARLMIQVSDNTAAHILGRYVVGMDNIQLFMDSWGMVQTDMENNKTSNSDISRLMEKMYQEKIANKALTLEMVSFLKDGTIEDRIPALLPKGTTVYHKTGNGVGFIHDVGIVVGPKTTYYIGIFTGDVAREEEVTQKIAELSKKVYDFMR
jgi:beta-lactamase class A